MTIGELWRYPVKSMGGERLAEAELGPAGVAGDRVLQVHDAAGRVVTARTHKALLRHRATLGAGGRPLVDGRPWDAPEVAREVEADAGAGAHLADGGLEARFDVLPLLVATDGAIAVFGHDGRRLRPNLVVAGVAGLDERGWAGRRLRAGECVIAMERLRPRCVMTTYHPDTLVQDPGVLRRIVRELGGVLALDCSVERGGVVRVGDRCELLG
jgi:MOSC domain-containing protein